MSPGADSTEIPHDEIRSALRRIQASPEFTATPRLSRFLQHVVEHALTGDADRLKEYSIALSVFDRDASFDQRTDTIVRVQARRLRQVLDSYYRGTGCDESLRIELPRGGYKPLFFRQAPPSSALGTPVPTPQFPSRRRWYWGSVGVVFLAALVWQAGGNWLRRPNPQTASLEGSRLLVFDSKGRQLWEKRYPTIDRALSTDAVDRVVLEDLDGDGSKEVLFNHMPSTVLDPSSTIHCYSPSGDLLWRKPFGASRRFGARHFDSAHMGRYLRPVRVGGQMRILSVSNHYLWYPSRVALLDPASGAVIEEYWHPGRIYFITIRDLDGDGQLEVVFAAINNPGQGLGHAALGVLPLPLARTPRKILPAGDPLAPPTGGGEIAYRLFPLPEVSRAMGFLPIPAALTIDSQNQILVLLPYPENGAIAYTFDSRLNLLEHRISDNYAALHQRLYQQKLIAEPRTPATLERLGRVAAYDAAPDGNSPAVERFWRD